MKIGILGCTGRMGAITASYLMKTPELVLTGGTVRPGNPHEGLSLNDIYPSIKTESTFILTSNPEIVAQQADVLIDFTCPEALLQNIEAAAHFKAPIVVCTTGLTSKHHQILVQKSQEIPVILASNTSIGVALLSAAVDFMARSLEQSYDIEIFEMHHRSKRDVPSGTALELARVAAQARGKSSTSESCVVRTQKRKEGEIGISSARGGGVFADVKVMFTDNDEMIELTHRALNREVFAHGAIQAAQWLIHARPGLYGMKDVLGLDTVSLETKRV